MGRRGPKPKETAQVIALGNPGHKRKPGSPSNPDGRPRCPEQLPELAKCEWRRVTAGLERLGILSLLDRGLLAAYCSSYANFITATTHLNEEGMVVDIYAHEKDGDRELLLLRQDENVWLKIQERSKKQMETLGAKFCLSSADRARLEIFPKPQKGGSSKPKSNKRSMLS